MPERRDPTPIERTFAEFDREASGRTGGVPLDVIVQTIRADRDAAH